MSGEDEIDAHWSDLPEHVQEHLMSMREDKAVVRAQEADQLRECLWWCYDLKRFGKEIEDEAWDFIGRLLGADTDHNDNEWGERHE